MTWAPDFVGCVPLWLVTKIAKSVVQLDGPVGGPPSHSPSEVYSSCKLCIAEAVFASWFTLFTTGTLPTVTPFFFSITLLLSPAETSPPHSMQCSALCAGSVSSRLLHGSRCLQADHSSASRSMGHLWFSSFIMRILMNCAVLTALCCSLLFRIFEFCNHLVLTTLFVMEVLDASWLWATLEALLPQTEELKNANRSSANKNISLLVSNGGWKLFVNSTSIFFSFKIEVALSSFWGKPHIC